MQDVVITEEALCAGSRDLRLLLNVHISLVDFADALAASLQVAGLRGIFPDDIQKQMINHWRAEAVSSDASSALMNDPLMTYKGLAAWQLKHGGAW